MKTTTGQRIEWSPIDGVWLAATVIEPIGPGALRVRLDDGSQIGIQEQHCRAALDGEPS